MVLLLSGTLSTAATAGDGPGTAAKPPAAWTMMNPTGRSYRDELVRLKIDLPTDLSPDRYAVLEDGAEVPWQVESIDGNGFVWVASHLEKGRTHTYTIRPGKAKSFTPRVSLKKWEGGWELDNGLVALRVPGAVQAGGAAPCPVQQVRLPDGRWVGQGRWRTQRRLKGLKATVVCDGAVFAKVRLRYDFEGTGGLFAEHPAFCQVDVSLAPGRQHAVIEESFGMGRDEGWEFDCAGGWAPKEAIVKPHFGGFDRPTLADPNGKPYPWPPESLRVGQTRMHDTLLNLIPRWSQAYDDGWFFLATDGRAGVGAMVCQAGKWEWPYDSMIEIKVRASADYAGLRCPTWRGKRYWYLLVGPRQSWSNEADREEYALRHACQGLDKLHQEYILDWPGLQPPEGRVMNPEERADWSSGAGRFCGRDKPFPGWGPGGAKWQEIDHPIRLLTQIQNRFDPDTYGTHWIYFSPENPNFFSAWVNGMFSGLDKLKTHPQFEAIRLLAVQKFLEELHHGVTLPGGAGQECFGYMARGSWQWRAKYCKEHLGVDATAWPYMREAGAFIYRTSQPMPDGTRRSHPGGDTHPPGPDVLEAARWVGVLEDIATRSTEEFPGFGMVFRNRPGTGRETYFAFKSGPNRGHFHGDQLSFHYAANGHPLIVDHHCSYNPRAGQEHMHNRVAFHTDGMPWANMDGYERLIAVKTSPTVDAAIGQVESERLRETTDFPPERWDWSLPQIPLSPELKYRRTVVLLKGGPQDIIVLRDQSTGPELYATYCLHVYGESCRQTGSLFEFDGVKVFVAAPAEYRLSRHDWEHANGGLEATKGLRLTTKGKQSEFITVLLPKPRRLWPVARLSLAGALVRADRDRRTNETTTSVHDLGVVLTWTEGKLHPALHVDARGLDPRARFSGAMTEMRDPNGLTVALKGETAEKQGGKGKALEFTLRLQREGDRYTGAFSGSFDGKQRSGKVTGTHETAGASPVLAYEEGQGLSPAAVPGGVKIGDTVVTFAGGIDDADDVTCVSVAHSGKQVFAMTGKDVDLNRPQGDIGLFVPDAGYPFGVIPDWLIRQRIKRPALYRDSWPPTRGGVSGGSR